MHPLSHDQIIQSLLAAYRQGFFPMAEPSLGRFAPLYWVSPDIRGVIPITEPMPDKAAGFHIPGRLGQRMRRRPAVFEITTDRAFDEVIVACGEPRWYEQESWIDERIIGIFSLLHERGIAHSIEVWLPGAERVLVGGLYGLQIGGAFFAESKFCRPDRGGTDASKFALVALVDLLRRGGFTLLDVQMWNEHLDQFGCRQVRRDEYLRLLQGAVGNEARWVGL
jgi:leucyl/phenylalanyl-tRNA---protein transferase